MRNFKIAIICALLLTCLTGFFALSGLCFANDIENITPEQKAEYLALPEQDSKVLMMLLIQDFTDEKINLETSGYSTANQRAVPSVLRSAVRMDILNHLLIHAPIETLTQIIKASVKISQSFAVQDVSGLISKIEKFTAQKAVGMGMDFLLANEIRISPGAMEFEYISQNNQKKSVIFQYIIVFQKIDAKFNKVFIKIYSPDYIEPPKLKARWGDMWGMYNDLTNDLPPFVVEIQGVVEKNTANSYKWTQDPKISIEFPDKVEDFGIKPLSFWEKRVFNPIESKVRDIKIVFTKLSGREIALNDFNVFGSARENASSAYKDANRAVDNLLTNMWTRLGKMLSDINPFGASVGLSLEEIHGPRVSDQFSLEEVDNNLSMINDQLPNNGEVSQEFLRNAQEQLDDIAEMIDTLSVRVEKIKNERDSLAIAGAEKVGDPYFDLFELAVEEFEDETDDEEENTDEDEAKDDDADADDEDGENEEEDAEDKANNLQEVVVCAKTQGIAPARNKVIFNEIAWMGNIESANDEWIELKNISGVEVDISGWQIIDKQNQIEVVLTSKTEGGRASSSFSVQGKGFYLMERGNDDSVMGIAADMIYKGALNNSNEEMYLFDENCVLQDKVMANPNWQKGNNNTKRTMERNANLEWQTSALVGGTPRANNSSGYVAPVYASGGGGGGSSGVGSSGNEDEAELEDTRPPTILITEIQIQGSETGQANYDFIELYNFSATTSTDISGCQIKKRASTGTESSVNLISDETTVEPLSYFVWLNSEYDEIVNYTGNRATTTQTIARNNSVALLDKDKNIIDAVAWATSTDPFVETMSYPQNPEQGYTLGRKLSTAATTSATTTITYIDTNNNALDFEIQEPSMGEDNVGAGEGNGDGNEHDSEQDVCDLEHLDLCVVEDNCANVGGYWYNDICNFAPEPEPEPEQPMLSVIINEIAWAGTLADHNDEWIELYNNTTSTIDIFGWTLKSNDDSPSITFATSTIPAQGFYLLERTDDDTIINIFADYIYTGAMNNSGETLELRDAQGNLIDIVDCADTGWLAGNNDTKQTMERLGDDWFPNNMFVRNGLDANSWKINGTPGTENSAIQSPTIILQSLPFSNVVDEVILYARNSPYLVSGVIEIPEDKTLIIEPGVILKFNRNSRFEVFGTLSADGSDGLPAATEPGARAEPEQQIIFTSRADDIYGGDTNQDGSSSIPQRNDWQGIYFMESSNGSVLDNCIILYSGDDIGGHSPNIAINIQNTDVEITNSIIRDFSIKGIVLNNSSSTIDNILMENNGPGMFILVIGGAPSIKNSLFRNPAPAVPAFNIKHSFAIIENNHFENFTCEYGVVMVENGFARFSGNTATNNLINGIFIYGDISRDWELSPDLPYIIGVAALRISQDAKFTILPGNTLKFKEQAGFAVSGTLIARGALNNKIIFTSLNPGEYWGSINLSRAPSQASTPSGEFENIIIENGGRGGDYAIFARNSEIEVDNAIMQNCNSGIFAENANYEIKNSEFIDCGNSYYCLKIENSAGSVSDSVFSRSDPAIKSSMGIMIKGENPVLSNVLIESNKYGINAYEADSCVDLSEGKVTFGINERANETNIVQLPICE